VDCGINVEWLRHPKSRLVGAADRMRRNVRTVSSEGDGITSAMHRTMMRCFVCASGSLLFWPAAQAAPVDRRATEILEAGLPPTLRDPV